MIILGFLAASVNAQVDLSLTADRNVRIARDFVRSLSEYDYEAATERFDATMRSLMPPSKLDQTWATLLGQVGRFREQTRVRKEQVQQYEAVFVTCVFERAELDAKVVIDQSGQIAGLFFVPSREAYAFDPPPYAESGSFAETEITIGEGEWSLPATLTLPTGEGPFATVVLVHGSGPNDRDETIGPNKPFRDLAWGLAAEGIAVLRYEKRTREHARKLATENVAITIKEEVIADALTAVSRLRSTPDVDSNRIFVLGHSLGGMLLPKIGTRDPEIAGLIIMAGPTRPLEDLIVEQSAYIFALDGPLSDDEKAQVRDFARQAELVKSDDLNHDTPSELLPFGVHAAYWLSMRGYDPPRAAVEMDIPILVLQGERDYQVTMVDFSAWQSALSSREKVQFKSYPALNHLFVSGSGRSTPAEYEQPGHVEKAVIDDIAHWIRHGRTSDGG
jgi:dienelactone hydrolase